VSHGSINCTDISQRLRLQGKYNDKELKNGRMKLILWTTSTLKDIIDTFYVNFIKGIENSIMGCDSWEGIKNLLENEIDEGDKKFKNYMPHIDVRKKLKNIKVTTCYDKKYNGSYVMTIKNMSDSEIKDALQKLKLSEYICINEIKEVRLEEFINNYGENNPVIDFREIKEDDINMNGLLAIIRDYEKEKGITLGDITNKWFIDRQDKKTDGIWFDFIRDVPPKKYTDTDFKNEIRAGLKQHKRLFNLCYQEKTDKLLLSIRYWDNHKILPQNTNNYIKHMPYSVIGDKVRYSVIKEGYKNDLPENYYFKTLDHLLYNNNKSRTILKIISPSSINTEMRSNISQEQVVDKDVLQFANSCCKQTEKANLRIGLKDIYNTYVTWCKQNEKKCFQTQKKFKEEFEKLNYKEEISKGVDLKNKHGKRGYNLIMSL
jgi:hypothetical protein